MSYLNAQHTRQTVALPGSAKKARAVPLPHDSFNEGIMYLVRDDTLHGCQETTADPPQFFELRASVARNQAEMEATSTLFVGITILQRPASKSKAPVRHSSVPAPFTTFTGAPGSLNWKI